MVEGITDRRETLLPQELVEAARKVVASNLAAGRTIAVAESCTGGLVGAALTEVPGSSEVFHGSVVPYSNEAKVMMLGIGRDIIDTFGSVSSATAWAMARGILERSGADRAVAITGIAGPDGGSERKPIGTVVFACADKGANLDDIVAEQRRFANDGRGGVRLQAALCALDLLMAEPGA